MSLKQEAVSFAIVAGEASGDLLGAGLIRALRHKYPKARFYGIGGPEMLKEGFESFFPMERLSVMGLVEVLARLFELISIRKTLVKQIINRHPVAFVGIDAPDFNLGLEYKLKSAGITTFHYVSPSVWAWRQRRVFKIRKAVDHMLVFMPFEVDFYQKHQIPVTYTGHPLADKIPFEINKTQARKKIGISGAGTVITLLPGSREQEVKRLAKLFFQAAKIIQKLRQDTTFIVPCVNARRLQQVNEILSHFSDVNIRVINGNSHTAIEAADALILASGTTTLEGMLYGKPMVVSYKLSWLTWKIIRFLVKTKWCALPNILAGKYIVPEILQDDATPEKLAETALELLDDTDLNTQIKKTFAHWHSALRKNASESAATAIEKVIFQKKQSPV